MEVRTPKTKVEYCEYSWACVFEDGTWDYSDNWIDMSKLCPPNVAQNSWLSVFGNQVWQASDTWITIYAYCTPQAEKYTVETDVNDVEVSFGFTVKTTHQIDKVVEDKVFKPVRKSINFGKGFTLDRGSFTFLYADETKQTKEKIQKVLIKAKSVRINVLFGVELNYFIRYGGTTWRRRFRYGKWKDNDVWKSHS